MYLKITYDAVRKCGILESDYLDNIREHFSVKDDAARIKKFYNQYIPARRYAITPKGRFEVGLLAEIYKYCCKSQNPIKVDINKSFWTVFRPAYSDLNVRLNALKLDLRDYQSECVQRMLKQGNGTVLLATAGGKTLLSGSLIDHIRKQCQNHFTLLIVPTIQLVEQTYKDFIDYGIPKEDITQLSGQHDFQLGKPITIALAQYLLVSKNIPISLFGVDLLIIDEVHGLKKGNQLDKFAKKFITTHKFGLTGSLPENKIDVWNIIGKIGPLIYERKSHYLREEGYLAEIEATILQLHYKKQPDYKIPNLANPLAAFEAEQDFIFQHPFRNSTIAKLATKTTQNTLIVVDRILHGELLETEIKQAAPNKVVYFVRGSTALEDREMIRELMEKTNDVVVIAIAKIFSTGINIKNLHYIILANAGKAKVRLIQSIGRGLRRHKNKTKLYLIDIADDLKYGSKHQNKRETLYNQEQIKYSVKQIVEP